MAEGHLDSGTFASASAEILDMGSGMLSCDGVLRSYRHSAQQDHKKWGTSSSGSQERALRTQPSPENAARERSRVRNLRQAFRSLQAALPSVPPDTKLSKLDVLVLATNYIAHLTQTLDQGAMMAEQMAARKAGGYLHPIKKWPMRSLLYCGNMEEILPGVSTNQVVLSEEEGTHPPI